MKIKTIITRNEADFDAKVNLAMVHDWRLAKREMYHDISGATFYAELVLPDPVPEPEQGDPVEALRCIRDFCGTMPMEKCLTECPLSAWCNIYTGDGISPADWQIPGEEAGQ